MKLVIKIFFCLISLFFSFFAQGQACNSSNIDLSLSTPSYSFNVNPLASLQLSVTRTSMRVRCRYWVGFGPGGASSYNPRRLTKSGESQYTLNYNILNTSNSTSTPLKTDPDATLSTEVRVGEFKNNQGALTDTYSYFGHFLDTFDISNIKRHGTYTDSTTFTLYDDRFPPNKTPTVLSTEVMTWSYTVPKLALVSLVDVGSGYTNPPSLTKGLDFGILTTGESLSFDMVLIYNAGFQVTFKSTNGEQLAHTSVANAFVPYEVTVNRGIGGLTLTPNTEVPVVSGTGLSPNAPTGDPYTVTVTIGDVSNRTAGNYSDAIVINIVSTE